jgi:hypothetical protein
MSEERLPKEDRAFTAFLLFVLKGIEITGHVGIVAVCGFAGWVIWTSGWKDAYGMLWPLIGVLLILAGSIWGAKLLRRLVL